MRQKKAKNKKEKPAHTAQNGQTGNECKSLHKAAIKHAGRETTPRNAGKEKPQKADMTAGSLTHSRRAAAPPCTPARRAKQGSKSPAHTSARRANGRQRQRRPDQARHKSSRLLTSRDQGSGTRAEKTPGHQARKFSQQRQAAQERPARQTARRTECRKTPPNRQNSHSLFCLPGGAL